MIRKNPFQNLTQSPNIPTITSPPGGTSQTPTSPPTNVTRPPPQKSGSNPGVPPQTLVNQAKDQRAIDTSEYDIALKEYEVLKQYNSPKGFLSTTTSKLPASHGLLNEASFPIGVVVNPYAYYESEVPTVNYGSNEIPRCFSHACRAYINPFVKWLDGGEKWICNFCNYINNVEEYYMAKLDKSGNRVDAKEKPDLSVGSYEFIANRTYIKKDRSPNTPVYIFLIDVSLSAVQNGYLSAVVESIKDVISNEAFSNIETTQVAFITYDTSVHFYSLDDKHSTPQMLCINDENMFLPTIKANLLVNPAKNKKMILSVLDLIQNAFNSNSCRDSNKLFNALNAAFLIAKDCGGKLLIFSASHSIASNSKTKSPNMANIPKDEIAFTPTDEKQLSNVGINLTNENISCDLFVTAENYINLITLNQLCDYSNGNIYFYKNFKLEIHYKNLFNQIRRVLTRPISWEAVMRTRFSRGYKIASFVTPVLLSNGDLIIMPTADSDQTYTFGLDMISDDKVTFNSPFVFIQTALLYSHSDGTRRIRIHNLCLPVSNRVKDVYDGIDAEALSVYYAKQTIDKMFRTKKLANSVIATESMFKNFITAMLANQQSLKKELSENLLCLPLYMLGILKHRIFCTKDEIEKRFDIDLSTYLRLKLQKMQVDEAMAFIYPRIYPLHQILTEQSIGTLDENGNVIMPEIISTHSLSLEPNGVYLVDNGYLLIFYTRSEVDSSLLFSLFGVKDLQSLNMTVNEDTVFGQIDELKQRIVNIIDYIRSIKCLFQNLVFVFEGTEGERIIKECLIEDNFCSGYAVDYKTFYLNIFNMTGGPRQLMK